MRKVLTGRCIYLQEMLMRHCRGIPCQHSFLLSLFGQALPFGTPPSYASNSKLFSAKLVMLRQYAPLNRVASRRQSPGRLLGRDAHGWQDRPTETTVKKAPPLFNRATHERPGLTI